MGYIGRSPEDAHQERRNQDIQRILCYPFTDSTMKERRNLLTASLLGILVAYVGIVPESLPVFGVEFAANEQDNLLIIFLLIIIYFAISFYVRAFSDVAAMVLVAKEGGTEKPTTTTVKTVAAAFLVRLLIDVGVPLLTAITALVGLGGELAA